MTSAINVVEVLRAAPRFNKFCSIAELSALVESMRTEAPHASVRVAGVSASEGLPIYHVRVGSGRVKALIVGWPHPNEPIGGLTVFSLLSLLKARNPHLLGADVEWHIVPCIDPEGATLNEGWTQQPFTIDRFVRNGYRQEPSHQVERSFPIHYKNFHFDRPIEEAKILLDLFAQVRPDFFFSLHNARMGGVQFLMSRDIGEPYYHELHALAQTYQIPLHPGGSSPLEGGLKVFARGAWELFTTKKYYDYLETTTERPETGMHGAGACSWESLAEIHPAAITFVMELPYLRHPGSASTKDTGCHLRQFRLRLDADNKYLITVILEEWEKVKSALDSKSPFYRKVMNDVISTPRDRLLEGLPSWETNTRTLLFSPQYNRTMSESDRFYVCMNRFYILCNSYEFVRLLKASTQTAEVVAATHRLESIYDAALVDLASYIDFDGFEVIDHDTLARMHLGGGLVVLNSVLAKSAASEDRAPPLPDRLQA